MFISATLGSLVKGIINYCFFLNNILSTNNNIIHNIEM